MMVRKDSEKDVERPRYYSQFWLDVSAGRRVIGGGKSALESDESEALDQELPPAPEVSAKSPPAAKSAAPAPAPVAEPPAQWAISGGRQSIRLSGKESLADLAAAAGMEDIGEDEEVPELMGDFSEEPPQASAVVTSQEEEPGESYDYGALYDEGEEEEEDSGWSARRGKKPKRPEKPRRREKGRDF